MVEIAADVQISEIRLITRSIMLNFINQGRGVVILPTGGVDGKSIKAAMRPYTTDEAFDSYVRIQEPVPAWETKESERSLPPYMVPVTLALGAGEEKEIDASTASFEAAYHELKARTANKPIHRNIEYDNLESTYARFPEKLLNEVGTAISATRLRGDLTMGLARPSISFLGKLLSMVDWHIKLSKKDGVLLLQGIKPYTNIYAVDCDVSQGYPVMKLNILI